MSCGFCAGELVVLGQLGVRIHFRCRQCGADSSRTDPAWEAELRAEDSRIDEHYDRIAHYDGRV